MRQPIFARTLLTLIAVLSLQHVEPARATLAGEAAEKPATADKATQTDPVSFQAALPLEGAMTPMDYQATDTSPSDDKQAAHDPQYLGQQARKNRMAYSQR